MGQDVMQVTGQPRALGQRRCSFPGLTRGRLLSKQRLGLVAGIQADGRGRRDHEQRTGGGQDGQAGGWRVRGVVRFFGGHRCQDRVPASSATRRGVRSARPGR